MRVPRTILSCLGLTLWVARGPVKCIGTGIRYLAAQLQRCDRSNSDPTRLFPIEGGVSVARRPGAGVEVFTPVFSLPTRKISICLTVLSPCLV